MCVCMCVLTLFYMCTVHAGVFGVMYDGYLSNAEDDPEGAVPVIIKTVKGMYKCIFITHTVYSSWLHVSYILKFIVCSTCCLVFNHPRCEGHLMTHEVTHMYHTV